ncbi:MAG: hypothetical protein IT308_12445 [Anaerolineaceae bacterium]|nr:hypothetical protein [Anaerolineaceae bacterium]
MNTSVAIFFAVSLAALKVFHTSRCGKPSKITEKYPLTLAVSAYNACLPYVLKAQRIH